MWNMFKVNNKDQNDVWTYFTPCSCVSIVNFEQVNAGWVSFEYMRTKAFGRITLVKLFSYGRPLITMNFGFSYVRYDLRDILIIVKHDP